MNHIGATIFRGLNSFLTLEWFISSVNPIGRNHTYGRCTVCQCRRSWSSRRCSSPTAGCRYPCWHKSPPDKWCWDLQKNPHPHRQTQTHTKSTQHICNQTKTITRGRSEALRSSTYDWSILSFYVLIVSLA